MSARLGIDIGGTFTDVVCASARGQITLKVPTTRDDPSRAVIQALAILERDHGIEPAEIERFAHGTTVATNAVIERKGARLGIVTTEGFGDTLEIGRQMRRQLYDLQLEPETPGWLAPGARRFEVRERIAADGSVVTVLDPASLAVAIDGLRAAEVEAVAVCLLFSFANPAHERAVAAALREALPGVALSLSSEVDPAFREYERTVVTAFDAYIKPLVGSYLARIEGNVAALGMPAPLQVMQSRGGLASAAVARERPVRLFLSGPAAGVIGARAEADRAGLRDLITIDIGGTSSDIALVLGGETPVRGEVEIAGYPVRVPMLDVVTLGAGGGSIAWLDSAGGLRVGPQSAGAEPGPACYPDGGTEPTVTDASLVLGYLDPEFFANGTVPLDPVRARAAIGRVAGPLGLSVEAAAAGIHRIANSHMADGMRLVSLNRGYDPREFALVPLGGAGGLHAVPLARELGIRRILIPASPGVLSAAGLLAAKIEHEVQGSYTRTLAEASLEEVRRVIADLDAKAEALMAREHVGGLPLDRHVSADLGYVGQSHYLTVPFDPDEPDPFRMAYDAFETEHRRVNGHATGAPGKLVALRVVLSASQAEVAAPARPQADMPPAQHRQVIFDGETAARETPILRRAALALGARLAGPAIIEQPDTTILVPPGWSARRDNAGNLVLEPEGGAA